MTTLDDLLHNLAHSPNDPLAVDMVVDMLQDRGEWNWPMVLGLLRDRLKNTNQKLDPTGLYNLAAKWYDLDGQESRAELIRLSIATPGRQVHETIRRNIDNNWQPCWSPSEFRWPRLWNNGFIFTINTDWTTWKRLAREVCDNHPVRDVNLSTYPQYVIDQLSGRTSYSLFGVKIDLRIEVNKNEIREYHIRGIRHVEQEIVRRLVRKAWPEPHYINLPSPPENISTVRIYAEELVEPTGGIVAAIAGTPDHIVRVESSNNIGYQMRPGCSKCQQSVVVMEPRHFQHGRILWLVHWGVCGRCGTVYYAVGDQPEIGTTPWLPRLSEFPFPSAPAHLPPRS